MKEIGRSTIGVVLGVLIHLFNIFFKFDKPGGRLWHIYIDIADCNKMKIRPNERTRLTN